MMLQSASADNAASGPVIRVAWVGEEHEIIVAIDNFHPDPHALTAQAANAAYETGRNFYPGVQAAIGRDYFARVEAVIARALREAFAYQKRFRALSGNFSLVTTPPAELALVQRIPHFDSVDPDQFALVHYLCAPEDGGTAFYRHRSTGFETVSAARADPYFEALKADFAALGEPAAGYIAGDTPIFAETARFEPRFNRALLYRSRILHGALAPNDRTLPAEPAAGRLTIASFIRGE